MYQRRLRYKGVPVGFLGLPEWDNVDEKKKYSRPKRNYLKSFHFNFNKNAPKNLILMYDIPHGKKKERDWLRRQLKSFEFIMVQKSVWVGPSPLPGEFLQYLKRIGLEKNFKIFKLARPFKN